MKLMKYVRLNEIVRLNVGTNKVILCKNTYKQEICKKKSIHKGNNNNIYDGQ